VIKELTLDIEKDQKDLENANLNSFALIYLDRQKSVKIKPSLSPDHNPLKAV
jgi:hypothetical protein